MIDLIHQGGQPGLFRAALFGLCPDCGAKTLFDSVSQFASRCRNCGLDYESYNVGDAAAAFVTTGVGVIIIFCAILLDNAVRPSFWIHAAIWIPVAATLTVLSMRMTKGLLLISKYRRSAHEAKAEGIQ